MHVVNYVIHGADEFLSMVERLSSYKIDDQRLSPARADIDPWDQHFSPDKLKNDSPINVKRNRSQSQRNSSASIIGSDQQLLATYLGSKEVSS